jgi:hypothetical protein
MEESDGERAAGSDTAEERAIRAMPIVTVLSYVRAVKDKTRGVRVTLTCYNCREYGSCEKPQEAPIHLSKERSTMRACFQELIKRLEENHGNCGEALAKKASADAVSAATVNPDAPNVLQARGMEQWNSVTRGMEQWNSVKNPPETKVSHRA